MSTFSLLLVLLSVVLPALAAVVRDLKRLKRYGLDDGGWLDDLDAYPALKTIAESLGADSSGERKSRFMEDALTEAAMRLSAEEAYYEAARYLLGLEYDYRNMSVGERQFAAAQALGLKEGAFVRTHEKRMIYMLADRLLRMAEDRRSDPP